MVYNKYIRFGDDMKKIILVDGNNLLFRSYYATVYSNQMMRTSSGFPTNALYGFVNMINKILSEEDPSYILIAFDKGKTFRHDNYEDYKAGRQETPEDLKIQFPIAKEILTLMGINYLECDGYEADDIIGTFANHVDNSEDFSCTIVSSDRDLLQLITSKVDVKLLKQKDHIRLNNDNFVDLYGIEPIKIIDLKALEGDASDNIPGVKGIGEKTALKLLQEYGSLENIYVNIDNVKGSLKDKLINDKKNAFMSKELATIYREVPTTLGLDDIVYTGDVKEELYDKFKELEFYSLLKQKKVITKEVIKEVKVVSSIDEIKIIDNEVALFLEIDNPNYHRGNIMGLAVSTKKDDYFVPIEVINNSSSLFLDNKIYTYDAKRLIAGLKWKNIKIGEIVFDTMLASNLLNYNVKEDIAYLANNLGVSIPFFDETYKKGSERSTQIISSSAIKKSRFIFDTVSKFEDELKKDDLYEYFKTIEFPLAFVLADMELTGVNVNKEYLQNFGKDIFDKLTILEKEIYDLADKEFNLSSPKQLGNILFVDLNIPYPKKVKSDASFSTDKDILGKLTDYPIVKCVLEYRTLSKLYSAYIEGLINVIFPDGKVHTIFTETLTRTGRLSSLEPNLQNIPMRLEYGRLIRKAFVPKPGNVLISSDYSQIELRILAHISNSKEMIEAFNNKEDIHAHTASEIFGVNQNDVTKEMRGRAKAINFGIIYGMSGFGLSENLDMKVSEAKMFIDKYLETFPGIKNYMETIIESAKKEGFVRTLMNRKRVIEEIKSKNFLIRSQGERIALNTPIQGTNADIIKKAMIELYDEFKKEKLLCKMIIQVHDELVFECSIEEETRVREIIKNIMENTYKLSVPLVVEIESGYDWYEAK